MTSPIPSGFHTLTPALIVDGAARALEFYERAFGAEVLLRLTAGELVAHSEVRIGDSMLYVSDPLPDFGLVAPDRDAETASWSTSLLVYCPDVDAVWARAVEAGAVAIRPVADQFHGDRIGSVRDPWGHRWVIATRLADVSAEEMQRLTNEFLAGAGVTLDG
jgi:PhnB protein